MTLNRLFSCFSFCKQAPLAPANEPQPDQRVARIAENTLPEAEQALTRGSSIKNLCHSIGASLSKAAQKVAGVFKKIFNSIRGCCQKNPADTAPPSEPSRETRPSEQPPLLPHQAPTSEESTTVVKQSDEPSVVNQVEKSSKDIATELFNDPLTQQDRTSSYAKTIPMLIASQLGLPEKKTYIRDFLASYGLTLDEVLSLESLKDRVKDPSQLRKVLNKVLEKDANAAKNAWLFGRLLLCYDKGTTTALCIQKIINGLLGQDAIEQLHKRGILPECREKQSNSANLTEGNEFRAWALGYLSIYDSRYTPSLKFSIEPLKQDKNKSNVLWAIVMALQSADGESYQTYTKELMNVTGKGSIREALEEIPISDFRGWATSLTLRAASQNKDQGGEDMLRAFLEEQLQNPDMPRDDRMLALIQI